jgi:hypothetical protein
MSVCSDYSDPFKYAFVCGDAKRHVLDILQIEDYSVLQRTYTCQDEQLRTFLNFHLPALREAVGVNHPLYVALTQEKFEDFRKGIRDYETLAHRVSFISGLHERLGQNSCVSMLGDDMIRCIVARAFDY